MIDNLCERSKIIFIAAYFTCTQGITESADVRFLQRLSVISGFCESVCDLLFPVETTVHDKWLPAETVRVNSRQEAKAHGLST